MKNLFKIAKDISQILIQSISRVNKLGFTSCTNKLCFFLKYVFLCLSFYYSIVRFCSALQCFSFAGSLIQVQRLLRESESALQIFQAFVNFCLTSRPTKGVFMTANLEKQCLFVTLPTILPFRDLVRAGAMVA